MKSLLICKLFCFICRYMDEKELEQIDDLLCGGLKVIQRKDAFRYGTDGVILSDFAAPLIPENGRVIDFGTGTGILLLLLSAKSRGRYFTGIELQPEIAQMAQRSAALNHLEDAIQIICGNIKNAAVLTGRRCFEAVVTNPPYKRAGSGLHNQNPGVAIARHEIACTLKDIICAASEVLVPGGHFIMVNRPERLADTLALMRQYQLEPKLLRFVHTSAEMRPILFLIDGILFGGPHLTVEKPLLLNSAGYSGTVKS